MFDTDSTYGFVSKLFHWLSALVIIGLFIVGFWMVELSYYSEWYKTVPHWHKSIGLLLFVFTLGRICWKFATPSPRPVSSHSKVVQTSARLAHLFLYLLLMIIMLSGYFISTADGRAIEVFNWFEVPALITDIPNQEDLAGRIHQYGAYMLIFFVLLHIIAALKHHFIDKDSTLKRMIN